MTTPATTVSAELLGTRFRFRTAPGLFSADRVDDGTKLLLAHLPARPPRKVLDVGCGYGALGLPVAALHPTAQFVLVDRDLLAVDAAASNAKSAGLGNVRCLPSLGYRDVSPDPFDWILCNVPARIGTEAIRYLLGAGAARLTAEGELRVVVIRDLGPVVEAIGQEEQWPIEFVAEGARHKIYRLGPVAARELDSVGIYLRDVVELDARGEKLRLERPQDISEDPTHLTAGLPLLFDCLPRERPQRAFVWRGGYGATALTVARTGAHVETGDRDLLGTTFTQRNAAALALKVSSADALWPHLAAKGPFDLVVCESAPQAGAESGQRELLENLNFLTPHGTLFWLALTRSIKDGLDGLQKNGRGAGSVLAQRSLWSVARLRRK